MAYSVLTQDERQELVDAAILKYRNGEFGPISFGMRMRQIGGIPEDEIQALHALHLDECAKHRRM